MTTLVTSRTAGLYTLVILLDGKVVRTFSYGLSLQQVAQEISRAELDFLHDFD